MTGKASAAKAPPQTDTKQRNLFSFFTRKDSATPAARGAPPAAAQASSPAASTPTAGESSVPPAQTPKAATTAEYGQAVVGTTVWVYWAEDDEYYDGRITAFNPVDGKHDIKYADGEEERVVLKNERLRWEPPEQQQQQQQQAQPGGKREEKGGNEEVESDGMDVEEEERGVAAPAMKKRKVIEHDDSEEEEFDFSSTANNGASSALARGKSSDDSPASVDLRADGGPASGIGKRNTDSVATASAKSDSNDSGSGSKRVRCAGLEQTPFSRPNSKSPRTSSSTISQPTPTAKLFSPATPASSVGGGGSGKKGGGGGKGGGAGKRAVSPVMDDEDDDVAAAHAANEVPEGVLEYGRHLHHAYKWLTVNVRDADGLKPDDPNYNPRTLWVPPDFLKKETPAMQQWWRFKAQHADVILFFKMGKFFEFFNQDCDIAVKELDLVYMKGERAHCGFPEAAYGKYAHTLVERGYRIARVEQTETPDMLKESNKIAGRGATRKVVQREVCALVSKGTRTFCYMEEEDALDPRGATGPLLMAIKERVVDPAEGGESSDAEVTYGVCMVDPTTSTFQVGQFQDDTQRWRLRTMLTQFCPAEVILERGAATPELEQMVRFCAPGALIDRLRPGDEYWDRKQTISQLKAVDYFPRGSKKAHDEEDEAQGISRWPRVLQQLVLGGESADLALSALGAVVWQLRRSLIDHDLVSMQRFHGYAPPDLPEGSTVLSQDTAMDVDGETDVSVLERERLILDGTTLTNLEVFRNSYDRSSKGSLWEYMNRCVTPFGARLFRDWLCKPLQGINAINARLDAVDELLNDLSAEAAGIQSALKKTPDLERLLARCHALGSVHRSEDHPESRAIMYETDRYNVRKISDFLSVLDGLRTATRVREILYGVEIRSRLLRHIQSRMPDLTSRLESFAQQFDPAQAKRDHVIKPKPGVDAEYDQALDDMQRAEEELDEYLNEQRDRLGSNEIKWNTGKDRWQLEVPESVLKKRGQPAEYETQGKRKGWRRFTTKRIADLVEKLVAAEKSLEEAQQEEMRRLFAELDESREVWSTAVQCMAMLDALLSLVEVSGGPDFTRPRLSTSAEPFICITQGRHPCLANQARTELFIANDVSLGAEVPRIMLLSGPNMGGKSTLLRQTCVLAIMAQMGCYVPAEDCHLTPVDRIFTRVGASDRILQGQSTFFVELAETANILSHATEKSLVILDELGRGTSTFDGTAIAFAVIKHMTDKVKCRTLFATHYHSLVDDFRDDARVCFGHMSCLVQPDGDEQKVTFLYHLEDGPSPKSYGINVARLAHLPKEVIQVAKEKSETFELFMNAVESSSNGSSSGGVTLGAELMAIMEQDAAEPQKLKMARELWTQAHM